MSAKRPHALAVPTLDLAALFRERLDAVLTHLRVEMRDAGDVPLITSMARYEMTPAEPGLRTAGQYISPKCWPDGLPQPLTVREALDTVEHATTDLVGELVAEVKRCARELVDPALVEAVLARREIVARWPWSDRTGAAIALRSLIWRVERPPPGEYIPLHLTSSVWPGEAAPLDVAKWARDRLNDIERRRMKSVGQILDIQLCGDVAVELVKLGEPMHSNSFTTQTGAVIRYPAGGMALLYLAERAVREGLRRPAIAISADLAHHSLLTGWRDIPRDGKRHTAAQADASITAGRVELLLPGHPTQLTLPMAELSGLNEGAICLLRDLRGPKGLRHWCALQRLFAVEGGRKGWVRWTLDEHLAAMGYRKSTSEDLEKRSEAAAEVEQLSRMELVVYDTTNVARHRAPLLLVGDRFEKLAGSEWRIEGMELRVNDLLYSGVRNPDTGKLGTNWWPVPVQLAQIDHVRHPYAHALGMLLAVRFRWDAGDGRGIIRLRGRTLLDLAGIPYCERRAREAWNKLRRELAELERIEMIEPPVWPAGEAWTLEGVCCLSPAAWIEDRTARQLHPEERPTVDLPLTGAELRMWREARGWSGREAARRLGVTPQALNKAEKNSATPLGAKVAAAVAAAVAAG